MWGPIILAVVVAAAAIGLSLKQRQNATEANATQTLSGKNTANSQDTAEVTIDSTFDQITNDATLEGQAASSTADSDTSASMAADQKIINSASNDSYDVSF